MERYFEIGEESRENLPQAFGKTMKSLNEDVKILREWMQTQNHLPEIMPDDVIRNFVVLNEGSIEKSKNCIDMYYTIRTVLPEIYENSHPELPEIRECFKAMYYIPLPKYTKELYRVIVLKHTDPLLTPKLNIYNVIAHILNISEIRMNEDFSLGDIHIVDMADVDLNILMKFTPSVLAKTFLIYEKVYRIRLKGIIFINSPTYIDVLIGILKTVLKSKIFDRVHFYNNSPILTELFPKELLPEDYGGSEKPLAELNDLMANKLREYKKRFDKLQEMKVDEELRPEKLENDESLGYHGTFKKINDLD